MDQDSGNEWNGLLRQIEKGVKKQIEATSLQQKRVINNVENDIRVLRKQMDKRMDEMKNGINELKGLMMKNQKNW